MSFHGRRNVLFITSNGGGLGHLTRLLAVARQLSEPFRPVFFTLSESFRFAQEAGHVAEYVPSAGASGLDARAWNAMFSRRLAGAIRRYRAESVLFDGPVPYLGLIECRQQHPDVPFVWSRRGMWRTDSKHSVLNRSRHFDLVVEPGDIAAAVDRGATSGAADQAVRVSPILLADETDLLPRDVARTELGLPLDRQVALIQLASDDVDTLRQRVRRAVEAVQLRGYVACVPRSLTLGVESFAGLEPVHQIERYPLSPCLRAFDLVISAAGYNSFHELVLFGVPTVFIPKFESATDDQLARARYAHDVDLARCETSQQLEHVDALVAEVSREEWREGLRDRLEASDVRPNGAREMATLLQNLVERPLLQRRRDA